jgi:hypothetical protein
MEAVGVFDDTLFDPITQIKDLWVTVQTPLRCQKIVSQIFWRGDLIPDMLTDRPIGRPNFSSRRVTFVA